jgi:pilus assembly protein Flp/PilA
MDGTRRLFDRIKRRQGQTAVEYALILAGIAIVALGAFNGLGNNVNGALNGTVALLSGTSNSGGGSGSGSGGGGDGHDHDH